MQHQRSETSRVEEAVSTSMVQTQKGTLSPHLGSRFRLGT